MSRKPFLHPRWLFAAVLVFASLDSYEWLQDVVRHGYVVAAVDVRGSGASFGRFEGMFSSKETQDAYGITEWLGTQPWSNGKVGMYGGSYGRHRHV